MVGIVVLIYKSFEQVLTYVRNELPKIGVPHRTLIVDTGSEHAHAERIAAELGVSVVSRDDTVSDGTLFVLHVEENLGYARGNNLGAEFLTRNFPDTDKLLFSNDDIEFISADVVDVLSRRLDELPEIGCIGPKVIDLNGDLQGPGYEQPKIGYYIRRNIGEPLFGAKRFWLWKDRERKSEFVNIVGGCFHMVRTADFQAVGGFEPKTFL
ncbi:MAG: glycosyltransferase family 2 protein, partial [Victivallales bacterium]|nr:glycosyltransferase family 2 protein [Victivallales bacterium]